MERVKELFKKLYDAHRYCESHPAIEYPDQYKAVVGAVEGWYDELEGLGVQREFSMCIYAFGSDWEICYRIYVEPNKPAQLTI